MTELTVFRFPISGRENEFFLLEVTSDGPSPLDLRLKGSEGNAAFASKVRQKRIDRHKASGGHISVDEWAETLKSTLVDQSPADDIEIKAELQSDETAVNLTFRKNIQGITQRLGTINIPAADEELSPFDWAVSAIGAQEKIQKQLAAAKVTAKETESSVALLKDQLEELIKAKDEDETQMLEKFRDLLNEKKVKIRQQQRLLASVPAPAGDEADLKMEDESSPAPAAAPAGKRRAVKSSRGAKRKVPEPASDNDSDDGFVKMEVDDDDDNGVAGIDPDIEERETTGGEETESDTGAPAALADLSSDEEEPAVPAPKTKRGSRAAAATSRGASKAAPAKKAASSSGSTRKTKASAGKKAPASGEKEEDEEMEEDENSPPPARALPFMRNRKQAPAAEAAPASGTTGGDEDNTESDDDEL